MCQKSRKVNTLDSRSNNCRTIQRCILVHDMSHALVGTWYYLGSILCGVFE